MICFSFDNYGRDKKWHSSVGGFTGNSSGSSHSTGSDAAGSNGARFSIPYVKGTTSSQMNFGNVQTDGGTVCQ